MAAKPPLAQHWHMEWMMAIAVMARSELPFKMS